MSEYVEYQNLSEIVLDLALGNVNRCVKTQFKHGTYLGETEIKRIDNEMVRCYIIQCIHGVQMEITTLYATYTTILHTFIGSKMDFLERSIK